MVVVTQVCLNMLCVCHVGGTHYTHLSDISLTHIYFVLYVCVCMAYASGRINTFQVSFLFAGVCVVMGISVC